MRNAKIRESGTQEVFLLGISRYHNKTKKMVSGAERESTGCTGEQRINCIS